MKQLRWIWILGIAAVLLTVVFIFVDRRARTQEEEARIGEAKQLFQINSDLVQHIAIDNEEGHFDFAWDAAAGKWVLREGKPFNVNSYALATICNYFCNLSSEKTVAFDCENTAMFGFDHPITLKVFTQETGESNPYVLYVGDSTPTYKSYYAMTDGSNDVYTIDYNSGTVFCADLNSLKNHFLFDTSASRVEYYKLEKDGKQILEMTRGDDSLWNLNQPRPDYKLSKSNVDDVMNIIVRVTVNNYIEDEPSDLKQYGLDHPHTKIWLKGTNGSEQMTEEIWFGNPISERTDETEIYGYFVNSKQVFTIVRNEISFTDTTLASMMISDCFEAKIDQFRSVEIDMGAVYNLHETLHLDYENDQYSLGDTDITALKDDKIGSLFGELFGSISSLRFTDTDPDAKPDPEKEPAITITYTDLNGKESVLTFIEKESNNYYYMLDGAYTGLTVRLNCFTAAGGITDRYEALKQAIAQKQK